MAIGLKHRTRDDIVYLVLEYLHNMRDDRVSKTKMQYSLGVANNYWYRIYSDLENEGLIVDRRKHEGPPGRGRDTDIAITTLGTEWFNLATEYRKAMREIHEKAQHTVH